MKLQELLAYKQKMFSKMSVEKAINADGFIPALYATEAKLVEESQIVECGMCEDTGIYHRQDGPDDFVDVKCLCQRSEEDGDGIDD